MKDELAEQKINGVDSYHYSMDINEKTIDALEESFINYVTRDEEDEDNDSQKQFFESLDKINCQMEYFYPDKLLLHLLV